MIRRLIVDVEADENLLYELDSYIGEYRNRYSLDVCASRIVDRETVVFVDSEGFHQEDSALADFTQRTVDELNKIEPFGAKFKRLGTRVYLNQSSALAILGWIKRHSG